MFDAIILGIVQGLTEFIPVSSSGHLVLLHEFLGMDDVGLAFDVALHVGTLAAVIIYFRQDIYKLLSGFVRRQEPQTRMVYLLAVGTIPAILVGVSLESVIESIFRSTWVVVFMLVFFGLIMIIAENYSQKFKNKRPIEKMSFKQTAIIGLLQACALVPGVSRSGATISGGLLLGFDRVSSTRFSFLLAIPIILGASVKVLLDSGARSEISSNTELFIVGTAVSFFSGMLAIKFLIAFVSRYSIRSFAYYRFVAAGLIAVLLVLSH